MRGRKWRDPRHNAVWVSRVSINRALHTSTTCPPTFYRAMQRFTPFHSRHFCRGALPSSRKNPLLVDPERKPVLGRIAGASLVATAAILGFVTRMVTQ